MDWQEFNNGFSPRAYRRMLQGKFGKRPPPQHVVSKSYTEEDYIDLMRDFEKRNWKSMEWKAEKRRKKKAWMAEQKQKRYGDE